MAVSDIQAWLVHMNYDIPLLNEGNTLLGPLMTKFPRGRMWKPRTNGMTTIHHDASPRSARLQDIDANGLDALTKQSDLEHFENLLCLFESRCRKFANKNLVFYARGKLESPPLVISYTRFFERIKDAATQLLQEEINSGSIVLIHLDNHYDNLLYWWAVTYAGFIPAMSTPLSNNIDQRRSHLRHLRSLFDDPLVLTRQRLLPDFTVESGLRVKPIEALRPICTGDHMIRNGLFYPVKQGAFKVSSDVAALMLTSGSTGLPKAVSLRHGLIMKAISRKAARCGNDDQTTFFNWIGADHVACLIEIHAHAVWVGGDQVHAEAADIVSDPLSFWKICHQHRVNHSFAPHFFLASLARALTSPSGVELRKDMNSTHLRDIITGGEMNVVESCLALTKILLEAGAPINCLKPSLGMTEICGGYSYSHVFPTHDIAEGHKFASVGSPLEGLEMRIISDDGRELPRRSGLSGMLQVKGDLVFHEYYNDPESTKKAFDDGWFNTGDRATIDLSGQLNLNGRAKDLLIINGVNYSPTSIETILDDIDGTVPSYTLALPYRAKDADTESLCVVYLPAYQTLDVKSRESTNSTITTAVLLHIGVRPLVIPLDEKTLQKSTLGKLPRNKISQALDAGLLEPYDRANQEQVAAHRRKQHEAPATETEQFIIDAFLEVLNFENVTLGATTNLLTLGINSVDIIVIKQKLQTKLNTKISIATIISSPTPRELAAALKSNIIERQYNPMVTLQASGDKAPLWLIHPGIGEVLIFLALAVHFKDRPVYAMRARGFEAGDVYFTSIAEAVQSYYDKIRQVQPHGPYALAGYSFGSIVAFELAKLLRRTGEVRFLGVFNLPPHVKTRMRQLDWSYCLLHLAHFLNFFDEDRAHQMHPALQQVTPEVALEQVISLAPPDRLKELDLDIAGLKRWTDLTYGLQSSATEYEPSGKVDCMDVFYCVPLPAVAKDMDDWVNNHLGKWEAFCEEKPNLYPVGGEHYTMISPPHVGTFQKLLKTALEQRNV